MDITECEGHLFSGTGDKEYYVWILCDKCAKAYLVDGSPLKYLGKSRFADIVSCDKCKTSLFFDEEQHYIDKAQSLLEPEEREQRDTDPAGPCSHREKRFSIIKMKEVLGFAKKDTA